MPASSEGRDNSVSPRPYRVARAGAPGGVKPTTIVAPWAFTTVLTGDSKASGPSGRLSSSPW